MDSNTHSTQPLDRDWLAALAVVADGLAAQDLDRLPEVVRAERVLRLRGLVDRLEGQWLKELAGVDALGAAGAEADQQAGSTAAWLRHRLRLSARAATSAVRTARALFRGPLTQTAHALVGGELSVAHAQVLAAGTHSLPDQVTAEAEPVLVEAARQLDPVGCGGSPGTCSRWPTPTAPTGIGNAAMPAAGCGWPRPLTAWSPSTGCWNPKPARPISAALEPLARPADAHDTRSGSQRNADALAELARRHLEGGRLPQAGGVRPQLTVTVDLDSLLGHPHAVGGEVGWAGPLDPEACRRLACDGAVTRVLVTRQHPGHHHPDQNPNAEAPSQAPDPNAEAPPKTHDRSGTDGLAARLQAAMTLLPPTLGGAPTQPLEVGRTTRVIQPAQHSRPGRPRQRLCLPRLPAPAAWCDAHHLRHWLHGGPTDLANLALLCRAHHRAVHEGGWRLTREPDGRLTATPPHRRHHTARRHPSVA